jgi:hypothetical protein
MTEIHPFEFRELVAKHGEPMALKILEARGQQAPAPEAPAIDLTDKPSFTNQVDMLRVVRNERLCHMLRGVQAYREYLAKREVAMSHGFS